MRVDTVSYTVNWRKFYKGHSFFVPCIDHRTAKMEVLQVTNRLKIDVAMKVVVEEGIKGLRVWRV